MQQAAILTTFSTVILAASMKKIIEKDNIGKIVTMAVGISLVNIINYQSQTHNLQTSRYFVVFINNYIFSLALFKTVLNSTFFSFNSKKLANFLVIFSMIYFVSSLILYPFLINPVTLLFKPNFIVCVLTVIFSIIFIFILSTFFDQFLIDQAIKRKMFHLGPMIVIPLINYLNQQMLVLLLAAGFYLFFLLEIIRYQSMKYTSKIDQNKILTYLGILFESMKKFNSRQPHFWFTHLFLILSLLLSYTVKLVIPSLKISEHVILCIIAADAMAALVGKKIGRIHLYQSKTLQGSIAFAVTFIISYLIVSYGSNDLSFYTIIFAAIMTAICQLFSGNADNLIPLLAFYVIALTFL